MNNRNVLTKRVWEYSEEEFHGVVTSILFDSSVIDTTDNVTTASNVTTVVVNVKDTELV